MTGYTATLLLFVFLLPGVAFTAGYERHRPSHGRKLKDWLFYLAGIAAACVAVAAWPVHWLYTSYWEDLVNGRTLPWPVYSAPAIYLVGPFIAGWSFGWASRRIRRVVKSLGPIRTPTAWDYLFESERAGLIRCKTRSGRWVGGIYDNTGPIRSTVSNGDDKYDIYISKAVEFDQSNGFPLRQDDDYLWAKGGIYMQLSDIEMINFIPKPTSSPAEEAGNDK